MTTTETAHIRTPRTREQIQRDRDHGVNGGRSRSWLSTYTVEASTLCGAAVTDIDVTTRDARELVADDCLWWPMTRKTNRLEIVDGVPSETREELEIKVDLCPGCIAAMGLIPEKTPTSSPLTAYQRWCQESGSTLSERDSSITSPQERYLRRLLNEAFSKRVSVLDLGVNCDSNHLSHLSRRYASWCIETVKGALERHKEGKR